jgi:hypothetical protein
VKLGKDEPQKQKKQCLVESPSAENQAQKPGDYPDEGIKNQGRISGVIVCLLPLAIGGFIAVINPGYLDALFTHPLGKTMIGIGVMGQLLGIFAIRKIIQIDV